jgi:hypothetical protein
LYSLLPSSKVASHIQKPKSKTKVKKQNPKAKKSDGARNPSRNTLSLDKVTLAKPKSKTKKEKSGQGSLVAGGGNPGR